MLGYISKKECVYLAIGYINMKSSIEGLDAIV